MVCPEYLNLYERLSAREIIMFSGHMYGVPKADVERRTEELLPGADLVNDANKLIVDYSVGMPRRLLWLRQLSIDHRYSSWMSRLKVSIRLVPGHRNFCTT